MVGSDVFPIEIVPLKRGHSFVFQGVHQKWWEITKHPFYLNGGLGIPECGLALPQNIKQMPRNPKRKGFRYDVSFRGKSKKHRKKNQLDVSVIILHIRSF